MKFSTTLKKAFLTLAVLVALAPALASAHQPRIVESRQTVVIDPEISKAYYGQLTGVPDTYTIQSNTSFNLYVNILVPYMADKKKDVSAIITKDGQPLATLDGTQFAWKKMFEPFGHDTYWQGPEYKTQAEAGTYVITVSSSTNDSKYSLAVGEIEHFDFKEIMNTLKVVPQLKKHFFNESPILFILSPFGWGLILMLYALAVLIGLLYRFIVKKTAKNAARTASKNIGKRERIVRAVVAALVLFGAIATSWNLVLIFLSGFLAFEALFAWSALYASLGKTTRPVK